MAEILHENIVFVRVLVRVVVRVMVRVVVRVFVRHYLRNVFIRNDRSPSGTIVLPVNSVDFCEDCEDREPIRTGLISGPHLRNLCVDPGFHKLNHEYAKMLVLNHGLYLRIFAIINPNPINYIKYPTCTVLVLALV
jgi:hypothetical protein